MLYSVLTLFDFLKETQNFGKKTVRETVFEGSYATPALKLRNVYTMNPKIAPRALSGGYLRGVLIQGGAYLRGMLIPGVLIQRGAQFEGATYSRGGGCDR